MRKFNFDLEKLVKSKNFPNLTPKVQGLKKCLGQKMLFNNQSTIIVDSPRHQKTMFRGEHNGPGHFIVMDTIQSVHIQFLAKHIGLLIHNQLMIKSAVIFQNGFIWDGILQVETCEKGKMCVGVNLMGKSGSKKGSNPFFLIFNSGGARGKNLDTFILFHDILGCEGQVFFMRGVAMVPIAFLVRAGPVFITLKILAICSENALLNIEVTNHDCAFIDFILKLFQGLT
jgi:hypothetical protein